jgi:hypothetical protein
VLQTPEGRDLLNDEYLKANVVAVVIDELPHHRKMVISFVSSLEFLRTWNMLLKTNKNYVITKF